VGAWMAFAVLVFTTIDTCHQAMKHHPAKKHTHCLLPNTIIQPSTNTTTTTTTTTTTNTNTNTNTNTTRVHLAAGAAVQLRKEARGFPIKLVVQTDDHVPGLAEL